MRNLGALSSDESTILIDHRLNLFWSMISWSVEIFLSLFITIRMKVWMSIMVSLDRFCFALDLEWSLNRSIDKNQMQFVYLQTCFSLWPLVKIFFNLVLLSVEMHKSMRKKLTGKNLNVYDQMKSFIYSTDLFLLQHLPCLFNHLLINHIFS